LASRESVLKCSLGKWKTSKGGRGLGNFSFLGKETIKKKVFLLKKTLFGLEQKQPAYRNSDLSSEEGVLPQKKFPGNPGRSFATNINLRFAPRGSWERTFLSSQKRTSDVCTLKLSIKKTFREASPFSEKKRRGGVGGGGGDEPPSRRAFVGPMDLNNIYRGKKDYDADAIIKKTKGGEKRSPAPLILRPVPLERGKDVTRGTMGKQRNISFGVCRISPTINVEMDTRTRRC